MAAELGQTLAKPWEIAEETDRDATNTYMYATARTRGAPPTFSEADGTVAPGQVTIRSWVRVSFPLD